jgi:hypothetical protein
MRSVKAVVAEFLSATPNKFVIHEAYFFKRMHERAPQTRQVPALG